MSAQLLTDELAGIIDRYPRTQSANEAWMMLRVSTLTEILAALRAQDEPAQVTELEQGYSELLNILTIASDICRMALDPTQRPLPAPPNERAK